MQSRCSERNKTLNGEKNPREQDLRIFFTAYFLENIIQPYLLFTPALKNLSLVSLTFL